MQASADAPALAPYRAPELPAWRHFVYVTAALARTEFKLRYFGSVLGYVWTLLRPLMLFGVLYVIFTHVIRFGHQVPHYPVVLLTGIVLFNFFSEATSGALASLVARENLLRKVAFPRAAIPIAVSLTAAANLVLGVFVVIVFAIINGVSLRLSWILFPLAVVAVVVLAMAVALLLAVLFVRYRDVKPIWEVALQLFFWGTPIIYTIESVSSEAFRTLLMSSPLAVAVQQARHWLIDPSSPSAAGAIGGTGRLLIPLAVFCAVLALGYWAFRRSEGRMAEDL